MEEGIARPIREFDEAEPFIETKPFYNTTDRWTGGWFEPGLAGSGTGSESTRLRLVVVLVEFATSRMPKILISHLVPMLVVSDRESNIQCALVQLTEFGPADCDPNLTGQRRCWYQRLALQET